MNWREYQAKLRSRRNRFFARSGGGERLPLLRLLAGASALLLIAAAYLWLWRDDRRAEAALPAAGTPARQALLPGEIDLAEVAAGNARFHVEREGRETVVELTIDEGLQKYVGKALRRHRVDWAGVAVLDAETGAVLALASHSEKEPASPHLALRATFPAASIFKIVTAAAAVGGAGYRHDTAVSYGGGLKRIRESELLRMRGPERISVGRAFGRSSNLIFGKLGSQVTGAGMLADYAERFGFNQAVPFDFPVEVSRFNPEGEGPVEEARLAAGFGNVTLSPLHGAMMAAAVLRDGRLMAPYVVERVAAAGGRVTYAAEPRIWKEAVGPGVASELRRMMTATVTEGTAQRCFRRIARDPVLGRLDVGGKTGSLSGTSPRGRTEWFVGYARGHERAVAVGIVCVSERVWRIKPSGLARDIFRYYFGPRPVLQARAATSGAPHDDQQ